MRVLFYDDAYTQDENILFENELLLEIPDIKLKFAHSFHAFEKYITRGGFKIVILDIMGAETNMFSITDNKRVKSDLLGLEMLKRLRHGQYARQKRDVLTIMRTARADEPQVKAACISEGADFIFFPSDEFDRQIIAIIKASFGLKQ